MSLMFSNEKIMEVLFTDRISDFKLGDAHFRRLFDAALSPC